MVVDAVDGKRVDIASARAKHDEPALGFGDVALQAEDVGERHFRYAPAADGRDAGAAEPFQRHRFAIGTDDFLDRRARDGKMLTRDRNRQGRDDRQRQRHAKRHSRAFAEPAVDLDDAADALDV